MPGVLQAAMPGHDGNRGHIRAWLSLREIFLRLEAAGVQGYPEASVLILMGDYCSTVEGAPLVLPLVYRWRRARLDELWRLYQQERTALHP